MKPHTHSFTCSGFHRIPGCNTRRPTPGSDPPGSERLETETLPHFSDTRTVSEKIPEREKTHKHQTQTQLLYKK